MQSTLISICRLDEYRTALARQVLSVGQGAAHRIVQVPGNLDGFTHRLLLQRSVRTSSCGACRSIARLICIPYQRTSHHVAQDVTDARDFSTRSVGPLMASTRTSIPYKDACGVVHGSIADGE
jgi:hypothetical protein